MSEHQDHQYEGVAFLGETLSPFYLYDPARESEKVAPLYAALASLDAHEAAQEWPFAKPDLAQDALALMVAGLKQGVDDDLIWEYRRLFVGPAKKAAPPWGSVYTDHECVVFGESTLALRRWMRENGIERLASEGDPEDHIGLMLMLAAWIAQHRPELLDEYLSDHLLTWAGHFLDGVLASSEHDFFKGLAMLTRASLDGIQRDFELDVTYPRFFR